jgi:hypothetical protein
MVMTDVAVSLTMQTSMNEWLAIGHIGPEARFCKVLAFTELSGAKEHRTGRVRARARTSAQQMDIRVRCGVRRICYRQILQPTVHRSPLDRLAVVYHICRTDAAVNMSHCFTLQSESFQKVCCFSTGDLSYWKSQYESILGF